MAKLFSQAYGKAVRIQPGQKNPLTEEEDAELRKHLYPRPHNVLACHKCSRPTLDRDRRKPPFIYPRGYRICGPCCYKDYWEQHALL